MKDFYCKWFNLAAGTKYVNPAKNFSSYFLSFDSGARLELMQMEGIPATMNDIYAQFTGLIHIAISVGSVEKVNSITAEMKEAGVQILGEPRLTGDGYYESVVADIEGNRIEITV